nr:unnamed protein product [Digitaria exilis]
MGVYLSTPKTDKASADGENGRVRFGLSSMQGWRTTMEDAGQRGWRELTELGDKGNKISGMLEGIIWSPKGGDSDDLGDGWNTEEAYNLSTDHKPDLEGEKERILSAGGFVVAGRFKKPLSSVATASTKQSSATAEEMRPK